MGQAKRAYSTKILYLAFTCLNCDHIIDFFLKFCFFAQMQTEQKAGVVCRDKVGGPIWWDLKGAGKINFLPTCNQSFLVLYKLFLS